MSEQNQKADKLNKPVQSGDHVGRDKITVGDITGNNKGVAVGAGSQVCIYELSSQQQAQEFRNRKQLIQNVNAIWIQGVLDQSLHKSAWIELGLKLEPEQVNRPLNMTWESDTEQQIVPLFQKQAANTLLILGKPGSGKTFTLLDLAQQLLNEAEPDFVAPIPVVFNLSSWALKHQSLDEWLLAELDTMYSVPEKIGRRWLDHDALILLLDGLDEVAEDRRQDCVEAINAYRDEHGLTGMVVCSRIEEYEALTEKLDLLGAVVIQPLTGAQAAQYLKDMGDQLQAVRVLLKEDEDLQKWVQSPLFLYVVAMAYRGLSEEQLRSIHTGSLHQLYDGYVTQMLKYHRPHQQVPYTSQQTRRWLTYLASRMKEKELTVYLIEQMQPDWLGPMDEQPKNNTAIAQWPRRILGKKEIKIEDTQWSWSGAVEYVGVRLLTEMSIIWMFILIGILVGMLVGVLNNVLDVEPDYGMLIGFFVGLFGGLVIGLVVRLVIGLSYLLICTGFGGIVGFLVGGSGYGLIGGLFIGLVSGMVIMLISILGLGLIGGFDRGNVRGHEKPNQGSWRTLRTGLLFGLYLALFCVLIGVVLGVMDDWLPEGPIIGAIVGVFAGVIFGLFFWLGSFVKHFALRKALSNNDYLPWRLVPFLEYAKERLLLRRVGGGYIFIHRTLQEYFAAQDNSFGKEGSQASSNTSGEESI